MKPVEKFLEAFASWSTMSRAEALDLTLDAVEDTLLAGDHELVDAELCLLSLTKKNYPPVFMLAILNATKPYRDRLRNRGRFYMRVYEQLRDEEPTRVDEMLRGLG